jgi:organic radical activating enzyme
MTSKITYFVQHPDITVGKKSFGTKDDTLFIRTHFSTVQGEGPFAGQYAYFLRLAGCNYGPKSNWCKFCDSEFRMDLATHLSFEQLHDAWTEKKCSLVVVTGGEPTLQEAVVDLCVKYPETHFQFETNGTQADVIHQLLLLPNVTVVISPKFSITGAMIRPSDEMLATATFKFLISSDPEHFEYKVPDFARRCNKPVFLSPIAVYRKAYAGEVSDAWDHDLVDHVATRANYAYAAHLVQVLSTKTQSMNVRLSIQQHLFTSLP